jgi:hypothetical protein
MHIHPSIKLKLFREIRCSVKVDAPVPIIQVNNVKYKTVIKNFYVI